MFSGGDEALVKGMDLGVVAGGDEGCHVEPGADGGATAPDGGEVWGQVS